MVEMIKCCTVITVNELSYTVTNGEQK